MPLLGVDALSRTSRVLSLGNVRLHFDSCPTRGQGVLVMTCQQFFQARRDSSGTLVLMKGSTEGIECPLNAFADHSLFWTTLNRRFAKDLAEQLQVVKKRIPTLSFKFHH